MLLLHPHIFHQQKGQKYQKDNQICFFNLYAKRRDH